MSRYSEFLKRREEDCKNARQEGNKKILRAYDRVYRQIENISERDFVEFLKAAATQHMTSGKLYIVTQKGEDGRIKRYELLDDLAKPFTRLVFSLPKYEKQNMPIRERISDIEWDLRKSKDKLFTSDKTLLKQTWESIFYKKQDELCSKRYGDLDGSSKLPTWRTYLRESDDEAE